MIELLPSTTAYGQVAQEDPSPPNANDDECSTSTGDSNDSNICTTGGSASRTRCQRGRAGAGRCCFYAIKTLFFAILGVLALSVIFVWIVASFLPQGAKYKVAAPNKGSCDATTTAQGRMEFRTNVSNHSSVNDKAWVTMGEPIVDETGIGENNMYLSNSFGTRIAASRDGLFLVVAASTAATYRDGRQHVLGKVSMYEWKDDISCNNSGGYWHHLGDLEGRYGQHIEFGKAMDISDDGRTLVVASTSGNQLPLAFLWEVYTRTSSSTSPWKYKNSFSLPQYYGGRYFYADVSLNANGTSTAVTTGLGYGFSFCDFQPKSNDWVCREEKAKEYNYLTMSKMGNMVFVYEDNFLQIFDTTAKESVADIALPGEITGYSSGFTTNMNATIFAATGRSRKYPHTASYLKIYVRTGGNSWNEATTDLDINLIYGLAIDPSGSLLAVSGKVGPDYGTSIFVLERQNATFWQYTATLDVPVGESIFEMKVVGIESRPIIVASSSGNQDLSHDHDTPGFVIAFRYD